MYSKIMKLRTWLKMTMTNHVSSDLQVEVHKYSNQMSQSEK